MPASSNVVRLTLSSCCENSDSGLSAADEALALPKYENTSRKLKANVTSLLYLRFFILSLHSMVFGIIIKKRYYKRLTNYLQIFLRSPFTWVKFHKFIQSNKRKHFF